MSIRHTRTSNICVYLCASMVLCLAGCETLQQDVEVLSRSMFPPSPTEAAQMMVDQYDADKRREGTVLISGAYFGGTEHYVQLYRFMVEHDPDPTVRAVAVRALARHGAPDDAPLVAQQLEHDNAQVRWEAAKGLQRLHNPAVVPALLARVRDRDEGVEVRRAAAHALGQYPQDRVFQALVAALDARELSLNRTAEQSLVTLTGQDWGDDSRAWLRWYNAVEPGVRFAGQQEYHFAAYHRDETFFERLAFWTSPPNETPDVPAGLTPRSARATYENDADEARP
jgi:hypothetical protein